MKKIIITKNDENQRLDKFLSKFMPALPKSMLYKSLRKNCVRINGKHTKDANRILAEGDELSLYFKDEFYIRNDAVISDNDNISVVYEDDNILVVNKPVGLVVHTDDHGGSDTLIARVKSYLYKRGLYDPSVEQSFTPALCNRLDRNTSGLVIAAKNAEALRIMNEKIKNREVKKYYVCITEGVPDPKSDTLTAYLTRGDKIVSVSDDATDTSKKIRTKYTVIKVQGEKALVEIELITGRTHQIRAQMAHIGCPIEGDVKYGAKRIGRGYSLCSYRLEFCFVKNGGSLDYLDGKTIEAKPNFNL